MKLLVSVERRYVEFEGEYYVSGIENNEFFDRYFECFKQVLVIARVEKSNLKPSGVKVFDRGNLDILPIYTKKSGLFNIPSIIKSLQKSCFDVVIIRTPGILAYLLSICFVFINKSFSLEVVTNPKQESKFITRYYVLNYFFSFSLPLLFRMQIALCKQASFVTENEIQSLYLSKNKKEQFKHFYSSINIGEGFYCSPESRKLLPGQQKTLTLLFVGVLDREFKGLDVFLNILAGLPENYCAEIVGDGKLLEYYIEMAKDLGIDDRLTFHGYVSDVDEKLALYRKSDLFILSSRREGLPRVVIEAMANSLPCVCSDVSGVRELIDTRYIFSVNDVKKAIDIILSFNSKSSKEQSNINYEHAQRYNNKILTAKRNHYYEEIKSL